MFYVSRVFSLSLCHSDVMLLFPQMDDSNFISWTYLGAGDDHREYRVPIGTVVEDDLDMFIPDTTIKRTEKTFFLDGKEGDQLKGHYFLVQDDGTRQRIDFSRNCAHIRVIGKSLICCMCNQNLLKT